MVCLPQELVAAGCPLARREVDRVGRCGLMLLLRAALAPGSPVRSGGPNAEERRQEETEVQELRGQGHTQEGRQSGAVPALRRDRDQAVSRVRHMHRQVDDRAGYEEQDQPDRKIELLLEFGYGLRSLPSSA
jgi:hypothetical protein